MLAVIAGTGSLPLEACKNLRQQKRPFFVVSLFPEDNLAQLQQATQGYALITTPEYYKASKIITLLKEHKATHVLLIGKVDKRNLLKKISLDWLALKLLASTATKSDTTLMQKVVDEFEKQGIIVIHQDEVVGGLLVKPGILTGSLTPEIEKDIVMGMHLAQKLSEADIGQTIVIKDQMVLAVEAIEGTDECIKRGIALGKKDVVICKAARVDQNKQFDLPTLGPQSLKNIIKGDVKAIAWQSQQTLIADKERFIQKAQDLQIALISVLSK